MARVLRGRGVPVTWMGAEGAMETRLVPQHDIAIDTLAITGLRGKGKLALLAAPWRLMRALRAAGLIIRKRQPRAVVAFGGFASGPGGMATRLHGLPLIVHEQNRAPGLTNRILSRYARRLLTGFPGTFAQREEFVGNPVRAEIAAIAPPEQRFADRHGRCACWWSGQPGRACAQHRRAAGDRRAGRRRAGAGAPPERREDACRSGRGVCQGRRAG